MHDDLARSLVPSRARVALALAVLALIAGCDATLEDVTSALGEATPTVTSATPSADPGPDLDRDGFAADVDCDDLDAQVHPGAPERCGDGGDDDCDGFVDEPSAVDAQRFHADLDGDGWGDAALYVTACAAPRGFVADGTDCDDDDADVHPGAAERCGDGVDSDCDGDGDAAGGEALACGPDEDPTPTR